MDDVIGQVLAEMTACVRQVPAESLVLAGELIEFRLSRFRSRRRAKWTVHEGFWNASHAHWENRPRGR